jgi:hypothetical protein
MSTKREEMLENIIRETMWMARRYAHGRSTYAPDQFNKALDQAIDLGLNIPADKNGKIYADDGMFGEWCTESQTFIKKPKEFEIVGNNGQILIRLTANTKQHAESLIPEEFKSQVYHIDEVLK